MFYAESAYRVFIHRCKPLEQCVFFQTNLNIQGDIDVSLAFHFPGKLVVTVHGATGLGSINGRPEAFVKLQVPGVEAVYHTQVGNSNLVERCRVVFVSLEKRTSI